VRERGWCVSGAPIAITVNGEERRVPTGATVAQLLAELELRRLESGDAVEIVTLVGGG
jgi:sulfur carrier protein ThiS